MWIARLEEVQATVKIASRNINNLRYADDTTLMAESEEELKSLLKKAKEESEKVGLWLNIQETKMMESSPISSWQINWGKNWNSDRFIFLGSKITADSDCNHDIKTLAPWNKNYTKPRQCIKKQRQHFVTKIRILKAMVFPEVIYGYESWTIKKAEC